MTTHGLKYGQEEIRVEIPDENLLGVLDAQGIPSAPNEELAVLEALENPVNSPRLREKVKRNEMVCIVFSDITRSWQRTHAYLPILVKEILEGGVNPKDISFVCATGTHRSHTPEEHRLLLGELFGKYRVQDHLCTDEKNLISVGTTSRGTPVLINKMAMEADHLILTGVIGYHFMAGWGGGRKSILPGIAGYRSIMANHSLALDPKEGAGRNMDCRTGNFMNNILHEDMQEAAAMAKPSFLLNVVMNSRGRIGWAVAGHWQDAYEKGTRIVDQVEEAKIHAKADLVITSAGGFPKDINVYQTTKALFNAWEAVKSGGVILLISACSEGYGNDEMQQILRNYPNSIEREREVRKSFTIAKYIGYCMGVAAEENDCYLVTRMNPGLLDGTGFTVTQSLDEALEKIYARHSGILRTWLMPHGGNTLPRLI
jgi:nickel-dependent lactate racemase